MLNKYSVLRFVLKQKPDGCYTQSVQRCGDFQSVELAFATARMEAVREWQESRDTVAGDGPQVRQVEIRDTEWGYELHRDHRVMVRYWVHDGQPAYLPGL